MTIDETIKHCLEVAEKNDGEAEKIGRQFIGSAMDKYATDCRECATERRQLAEWLTELKELRSLKTDYVFFKAEAKKLLRTAVEDFSFVSEKFINSMDSSCSMFNHIAGCVKDCPMSSFDDYGRCKWRYTDEALKLIGDDNNGT